jgi:DHA2 family multidrug resistance protein
MVALVGLVQYATLALLSPYLQNLSGDPVITTGLLLGPRGFGTMFAMLVAGRLINRVDVRYLIMLGFILGVFALLRFIHWTPDVSQTEVVVIGLIQGCSVGLIFMPLSAIIYATLPLELRVEAAGVFSLVRNLGSAIGISITGALLTSNTQVNHEIIGAVITPFNHALALGGVGALWNPLHPAGALALNDEITRQAQIISYADDFWLMLALTLVIMPLVFLLRPGGKTVAARAA